MAEELVFGVIRKKKLSLGCPEFLFDDDSDDDLINKASESFDKSSEIIEKNEEVIETTEKNEVMKDEDDDYIMNAVEHIPVAQPKKLNSKTNIERNHLQAIIRLKNNGPSGQRKWDYVSDYFYHVEEWPNYAIKALISKNFNYNERLALASFLFGNGLRNTDIATQFIKLYKSSWAPTVQWNKRLKEFEDLFSYMDKRIGDPDRQRIQGQYFYYNMHTEVTMYLNGMKRARNGDAVEYKT